MLKIKDGLEIHLAAQVLDQAMGMMVNVNERCDQDFSLIQVPSLPRSVPQGSGRGTLIISCILRWPISQTKVWNSGNYSHGLRACRKSKTENTWQRPSAPCIEMFSQTLAKNNS